MIYQALYRKYRPKNFDEVVGQEFIKKTLMNAIITNKISHAYLLSGPRGTGKTTIAKIFARSINCASTKDGNPCEKCYSCLTSKDKECTDIIEIDAASNNGVEEIRELKNKINHVPSQLKYKVYIIDEVHMLSPSAFNALLKTLEEPPSHAIFILATTDVHKIPITIISRCQTFVFKRIDENEMVKHLKEICNCENIKIEDEVLKKISLYSDGCLRDALGLLDKLSSYESELITMNSLEQINGSLNDEDILSFINDIKKNNIENVIIKLNKYYNNGKDMVVFAEDIVEVLEKKLINYYLKKSGEDIDVSFNTKLIYMLNDLTLKMKSSNKPKMDLEVYVLKFMEEINKSKIDRHEEFQKIKIEPTYQKTASINENRSQQIISREIIQPLKINDEIIRIRINNSFATASKPLKQEIEKLWPKIKDYTLDQKYGSIARVLTDATIQVVGKNNILITYDIKSYAEKTNEFNSITDELINKVLNNSYKLVALTTDDWLREKKSFLEKYNAHEEYKYINEPKIDDAEKEKKDKNQQNESNELSTAIEMFGSDLVKID